MLVPMLRRRPDSRGLAVDAEGAVLGPDCVLVQRTSTGFRPLDAAATAEI